MQQDKVRQQNEENVRSKIGDVVSKRQEKEKKLEGLQHQKEDERTYKHNLDVLKSLDKHENVKRNERKKEYDRQMLIMKQALIDERIQKTKQEKHEVLQGKAEIKKKIEFEKQEMQEKFKLVQQGKLDPTSLKIVDVNNYTSGATEKTKKKVQSNFDVNAEQNYQKPFPNKDKLETREEENSRIRDMPPQKKLEQIRTRQNREMLRLLEDEQVEENKREMELARVVDNGEKKRLKNIFDVEKQKAKERIEALAKKHDQEISALAHK